MSTFGDFFGQKFRRSLRQTGDNAETAGIGDRGSKFSKADIVHSALDDRMLNAEHFGDRSFHWTCLCICLAYFRNSAGNSGLPLTRKKKKASEEAL
jgi:hypothetical protein